MILSCYARERRAKYLEEDPSSKEVTTKVIGIQLYEEGMRLDGEWFDNKSDLTEDYLLERSYVKSKDNITAARNFSTNALIEGREIQTIKIDKVEINILTNDIFWTHEFNRVDKTNTEEKLFMHLEKVSKAHVNNKCLRFSIEIGYGLCCT